MFTKSEYSSQQRQRIIMWNIHKKVEIIHPNIMQQGSLPAYKGICCDLKHVWNIFSLSRFSFTDNDDSLDNMGGTVGGHLYSSLPLPPAHEHSDIYLQLSIWHTHLIYLITSHVITWLLLDEICPAPSINIWSNVNYNSLGNFMLYQQLWVSFAFTGR